MATGPTGKLIQRLRTAALARESGAPTDGELLESFIAGQDGDAFEGLVRRHGPMVLGVCQRLLGNRHDAEDALQATFLVLARRASAVLPRDMVGNWLYGVAYRTASKARAMKARRRVKEGQVRDMPRVDVHDEAALRDLLPVLDRELQALPDKYRAPIVLCDLEGKQRKEVARQLGWPEGTVSSRLATGRRMLARRLNRRGVSASGAVLACLHQVADGMALPQVLVASTVNAAVLTAAGKAGVAVGVSASVATLADGVLKAMLLAKLKFASAAVCLAALVGMAGDYFSDSRTLTDNPAQPAACAPAPPPARAVPPGTSSSVRLGAAPAPREPQGRDAVRHVVIWRQESATRQWTPSRHAAETLTEPEVVAQIIGASKVRPQGARAETPACDAGQTVVVVIAPQQLWQSAEPVIAIRVQNRVWQTLRTRPQAGAGVTVIELPRGPAVVVPEPVDMPAEVMPDASAGPMPMMTGWWPDTGLDGA